MINANELRIGNWIMVAGTGEPHPIQVTAPQISQLLNMPDMAARIPINEDWLMKLGFDKGAIRYSYHTHLMVEKYTTATQGWINNAWRAVLIDSIPYHLGNQFQYVHQIQNLYFALTGEELKIK